ncbi:MAG: ABC transporter permease [Bacteroidota bacterium]
MKFKLAVRGLLRSSMITYMNIAGLAVAFCAVMVIYLYVKSETSVDTHLSQGGDLYRIIREVEEPNSSYQSPTLAAPYRELLSFQTGVPQKDILRIYQDDELVSYKETSFFEPNVLYVDGNFFELLDYKFKFGSADNVLQTPNAAVISEGIATRYFGDTNPIGEILEVEGKGLLEVKGVIVTSAPKSHLNIDFVVNNGAMGYASRFLTDKDAHAMSFYIKVPQGATASVAQNLHALAKDHLNNEDSSPKVALSLQPLAGIYFGEPLAFDIAMHGNWTLIQTLIAIAVILLLVISANFINLTIARLSKSAQQTGVKKILGSSKMALIVDWALEVYLKVLLASLIALTGCNLILPFLSQHYEVNVDIINYTQIMIGIAVLQALFTLIVVTIPGLIFSSLNPFSALSGQLKQVKASFIQHKLLFFQFASAFVLVTFTIVIVGQFQYMQEKELGLDDDQVLIFDSNNKHSWQNRTHIKNAIAQLSGVKDVSMTYGGVPSSPTEAYSYQIDQSSYQWNTAFVQPNLIELLDLRILDGSSFDERKATEANEAIILNETAAKALGWPHEQVIGKYVTSEIDSLSKRILGIVQDYHYESFKNRIEPLVIQAIGWEETFIIKLQGKDYQTVLSEMESIWKSYVPKYPFSYRFLDQSFQRMHLEDTKNRDIVLLFTLLTVIITAMGTLSLGALILQARIKEITIRKVLGASVFRLLYSFCSRFIKALLFSSLIAVPVAWIFAKNWLDDFTYRIDLSPIIFMTGFVILLLIVLVLIVIQSWKTATSNPVKHLRLE